MTRLTGFTALAALLASASVLSAQGFNTLAQEDRRIGYWGLPNTAAYGQSVTFDAPFSFSSASFRIDDQGTPTDFTLHVLSFDSATRRASGPSLVSGSGSTAGVSGMETVTVLATSPATLAAGEYIVVLQAMNATQARAIWGATEGSVEPSGTFVYQSNGGDAGRMTSSVWRVVRSHDLAFAFNLVSAAPPPDGFGGAMAGAARLLVVDVSGVAREAGQDSLATRAERLSFMRTTGEDGEPVVTMSSMDSAGMMGDLYGWVEMTGFYASDDSADRSLRGYGLQIGADIAIGPDRVLGLSLGASDLASDSAGTRIEGTLVYVQPYLSYRSGAWSGAASLVYGQGDFEQSGTGGAGTGETRLMAVTFDGAYDIALQPGLTATPMIGLVYGREEVTAATGAVTAGTEVDFYQVSLGGRLTHEYDGNRVFGGIHLEYQDADSDTVLAGDIMINEGVTGRIEIGGAWQLGRGVGLETSFEIGGIGGDLNETSAALRATFRF